MANLPILGDQFQEPTSPDTTSAPSIPQPQIQTPLQKVLQNQRKKKNPRNPAPLAAQIGRSRRAYQRGDRWGS